MRPCERSRWTKFSPDMFQVDAEYRTDQRAQLPWIICAQLLAKDTATNCTNNRNPSYRVSIEDGSSCRSMQVNTLMSLIEWSAKHWIRETIINYMSPNLWEHSRQQKVKDERNARSRDARARISEMSHFQALRRDLLQWQDVWSRRTIASPFA